MTTRRDLLAPSVMVALTAWAFVDVVALHLLADGGVVVGVDGPFAGDQFQYLSWIRESGEHGVIRNLYAGAVQSAAFVHPMFLVSGALHRAGVPLAWTYLLWKPVAAVAVVAGIDALARRVGITDRAGRLGVLVLAGFAATPLLALARWWGTEATLGDVATASPAGAHAALWGYLATATALGLLAAFVALLDRSVVGAAASGLLLAWLHPWEGAVALIVVVVVSVWRRAITTTWVPALATALPLAYYLLLERHVAAWSVANEHVAGATPSPAWLLATVGPLAAVAALAGRGDGSVVDTAVRVWPCVAVAAALTLGTTAPTHFLASATIPLAVLAVQGWRRVRAPAAVAVALIALVTVPGVIASAQTTIDLQSDDTQPHIVEPGEADALEWLADARPGTVLAPPRLATAVPALTGQPTWYGHPNWTPDYAARAADADRLFRGDADADVVRRSGARYVVADCTARLDVAALPTTASVHRFGCASVAVVRPV